jgi:hypothetical protein
MKNLRTPVLSACFVLSNLVVSAQIQTTPVREPDYNKPKLFTALPDVIPVSINKLNSFLAAQKNASIATTLSADATTAPFEGNVVVSTDENGQYQRVAIKSTNYNGAILSISKRVLPDGSVAYASRLLSFQHGDAYVLEKQADGYAWVKKNFYDIINE